MIERDESAAQSETILMMNEFTAVFCLVLLKPLLSASRMNSLAWVIALSHITSAVLKFSVNTIKGIGPICMNGFIFHSCLWLCSCTIPPSKAQVRTAIVAEP